MALMRVAKASGVTANSEFLYVSRPSGSPTVEVYADMTGSYNVADSNYLTYNSGTAVIGFKSNCNITLSVNGTVSHASKTSADTITVNSNDTVFIAVE